MIQKTCTCKTGFFESNVTLCGSCLTLCITCVNASTCSSCNTTNNLTLVSNQCICLTNYQLLPNNTCVNCPDLILGCVNCTDY